MLKDKNLTKKLKWLSPIILAFGSVLLAVLLCELLLRLFFPQNNLSLRGIYLKDDKLGYRPKPNYSGKLSDIEFKISVDINSYGFRDQKRPNGIDKNAYRLLSLGDSFTFGLAVNIEETYSSKLEEMLNNDLKAVFQVFNLGVPGYGPDNEYYTLEKYISTYKPNLVLLGFFIGNDVRDAMLGSHKYDLVDGLCVWNQEVYQKWMNFDARQGKWQTVGATGATGATHVSPAQKSYERLSILQKARKKLKSYLRSHLHIYQLVAKANQLRRLSKATNAYNVYNIETRPLSIFEYETFWLKRESEILQEGYKTAFDYLFKMKKISEEHGAKFLLLLIPPKEQVHNIEWEKSKKRFTLVESDLERHKPQRLIKEWADKNRVDVIDLLPEFRALDKKGVRLYFYKDGHFNLEGHQQAAEVIYQRLRGRT